MNKRKTYEDYVALAQSRGLIYLNKAAQNTVWDTADWECRSCHRRRKCSYHSVQSYERGCACQSADYLVPTEKYATLAAKYNLKCPSPIPRNTRTVVEWINQYGHPVKTTYQLLARPSKALLREINRAPSEAK